MHITDAIERYIVQLQADGRSHHTIAQYRRHLQLLDAWLADDGLCGDVSALDHETIARFLTSPVANTRTDGRPKKATAMNTLRSSLKVFGNYLHSSGHVLTDPGRMIRRARCGSAPPRTLSDDDQRRLIETLKADDGYEAARDHAMIALMLATGIRLASALELDVTDVDLERGDLQLRSTKGDRPGVVYLGETIREHLARYIDGRDSGPLFTARHGGRLSRRQAQRRFEIWLDRAGITQSASPHSLRHTFATKLYRKTGDVLLVKEALQHRSIASTLVYARASRERLREALG